MARMPPETLERMRQLREEGKTNQEIADECGLPYKTVCNVLYNRFGPKTAMQRTPPEIIEKIRALRAQGKKVAEIAEECGVSEFTVCRYAPGERRLPQRTEGRRDADGAGPTAKIPAPEAPAATARSALPEQPRPPLSIRERGPGARLRGLLVGAGEMVAALGGQVEVVVSVRRVGG